jgi:hypothetical protein
MDEFGETGEVVITVLVDNRADLLVKSTRSVRRFTSEPLLAEHGFAALVELRQAGLCVLWDAGMGEDTLLENMRRMKLDPRRIDVIALSHGHRDHTGGLARLLDALDLRPRARQWRKGAAPEDLCAYAEGRAIPISAHPAALRERWWVNPRRQYARPRCASTRPVGGGRWAPGALGRPVPAGAGLLDNGLRAAGELRAHPAAARAAPARGRRAPAGRAGGRPGVACSTSPARGW